MKMTHSFQTIVDSQKDRLASRESMEIEKVFVSTTVPARREHQRRLQNPEGY